MAMLSSSTIKPMHELQNEEPWLLILTKQVRTIMPCKERLTILFLYPFSLEIDSLKLDFVKK